MYSKHEQSTDFWAQDHEQGLVTSCKVVSFIIITYKVCGYEQNSYAENKTKYKMNVGT